MRCYGGCHWLSSLLARPLASPPARRQFVRITQQCILAKYCLPAPTRRGKMECRRQTQTREFSKGDFQHTFKSRFRSIIDVVKIQRSFFTFLTFWNKLERYFSPSCLGQRCNCSDGRRQKCLCFVFLPGAKSQNIFWHSIPFYSLLFQKSRPEKARVQHLHFSE